MARLEWEVQLDAEFAQAQAEIKQEFALRLAALFQRIVQRTPVRTGLARSNWFLTQAQRRVSRRTTQDVSGGPSTQNALTVLANWVRNDGWESLVIYNNLRYIVRLENGYSDQAPNGMLAVSVAEFETGFG